MAMELQGRSVLELMLVLVLIQIVLDVVAGKGIALIMVDTSFYPITHHWSTLLQHWGSRLLLGIGAYWGW